MSASERVPCFAAVHQEQLLEAMGAGFLAPPRDDLRDGTPVPSMLRVFLDTIPDGALADARGGRRHGAVFVLQLAVPIGAMHTLGNGGSGIDYPAPISWIRQASGPDEDALNELRARAGTFPDLVEASIPLTSEAMRLPVRVPLSGRGNELELNLNGTQQGLPIDIPMLDAPRETLLHGVDKVGGAAVGMLWGGFWDVVPDEVLADVPGALGAAGAGGASLVVAMTNLLLHKDAHASDRALLEVAARRLDEADPFGGIDPASFLSECVEVCLKSATADANIRRELEEFRAKANDVLASRIELRPELLTDTLHIGSRALIVFLLNPTQVGLARFLARRPTTGRSVALLSKMLVGVYNGLAAMPKELKGAPPRLLGQLAELALVYQRREGFPVSVSRGIDGLGRRHIAVRVVEETIVDAFEPGDPRMEKVLVILAALDATTRFEPATGCFVARGGSLLGERDVQVALRDSWVRLPVRSCVELTCHIAQLPKAFGTKEGLAAALRHAGTGPVSMRLAEQGTAGVSCSVLLEEEAADKAGVRAAMAELLARVAELAPAMKSKSRRAPKIPGAAPRKRKPTKGEGLPPAANET